MNITTGANESAKFWMNMLNELRNGGVEDVLFFCVDGLTEFRVVIHAVYPHAKFNSASSTC